MTITIIKGTEVNRPATTPLGSSVLDHATVVTNSHFGLVNNEGLWPSYNCIDTLVPTPMCPDPMTGTKTFVFGSWQPAFDFALYGGVQCSNVGLDVEDMTSEIKRVFALNEGKGIEQALLFNRFVGPDSDSDVPWDEPTDLTPATAVPLYVALAILEGYAATVYAGVPTIHMPRAAAEVLGDRIVWTGGKAYTRMGSKVAIGGGYDAPGVPDGTWDLYASGEVYVERSEEIGVHQYTLPGYVADHPSDPNNLTDNSSIALAERMFRVAVDCFVAKVTATVWS